MPRPSKFFSLSSFIHSLLNIFRGIVLPVSILPNQSCKNKGIFVMYALHYNLSPIFSQASHSPSRTEHTRCQINRSLAFSRQIFHAPPTCFHCNFLKLCYIWQKACKDRFTRSDSENSTFNLIILKGNYCYGITSDALSDRLPAGYFSPVSSTRLPEAED